MSVRTCLNIQKTILKFMETPDNACIVPTKDAERRDRAALLAMAPCPRRNPISKQVLMQTDLFDQTGLHQQVLSDLQALHQTPAVLWIDLQFPAREQFQGLQQVFGLHPLAMEDAVTKSASQGGRVYR